jgi:predicted nucleic acid-binding protein
MGPLAPFVILISLTTRHPIAQVFCPTQEFFLSLDTNIVSAWSKGEISIADKIDSAESIFLPITVIGELYYGAAFSSQVAKNTQDIKKITSRYQLLSIDEDTT